MKHTDENLILDIVKDYSKNKKVLIINSSPDEYIKSAEAGQSSTVESINEKPLDFITICEETNEYFDFIVLHSDVFIDQKDFNLQLEHKELVRRIMQNLLNDSGIFLFIVRDKHFIIDQYLKPGADKLTKKLVPDTLKVDKPFQVWAFYN